MGFNSGIEWTDHTWNPWHGCRKVSAGCDHCYMFREKKRFGQDPNKVVRSQPRTFSAPLRWTGPARVFVCSWSDFFIADADAWRADAWEIIRQTPQLTYQILTKRPENIKGRLPEGWPWNNVWLGVTVENQEMANKRLTYPLFDFSAEKRFVSIEPMLGPVDLEQVLCREYIEGKLPWGRYLDWVIVGGETGPKARYMDPAWAGCVRNACVRTKTPFFMKQMTNKTPIPDYLQRREFPYT